MIKKNYFQDIEKLKKSFEKDKEFPCLILFEFLDEIFYGKLKEEVKNLDFKKDKKQFTYSYGKANPGELLKEFIDSNEFKTFVKKITSRDKVKDISIYKLSWQDYMILNDQNKEESEFDLFIDFTEEWNEFFGGSLIYVDGTGDYLKIPIRENMAGIIKKNDGVNKFIKYVNNHSGNQTRLIGLITF